MPQIIRIKEDLDSKITEEFYEEKLEGGMTGRTGKDQRKYRKTGEC